MNMDQVNKSDDRKLSIQGLRAIAFMMIFFAHCQILSPSCASLGVSIFVVMSGFLLEIRKSSDYIFECNFRNNVWYSYNKINKLYLLHIICMLMFILPLLVSDILKGTSIICSNVINMILNITLIQSWCPSIPISQSLNGVAWYLSLCTFLYAMYPLIHNIIRRLNMKKKYIILGLLFILMVLLRIITINFEGLDGTGSDWFCYVFPGYRLLDFSMACIIGNILKEKNGEIKLNKIHFTVFEIMCIVLSIMLCIIQNRLITSSFGKIVLTSAIIDFPLSIMMVVLMYYGNGFVSILLNNNVIVKIGNMSPYLFLTHYVLIIYAKKMVSLIIQKENRLYVAVVTLVISIIMAWLYEKVIRKKGR